MLVSQGAEAFIVSTMACSQEHIMMSDMLDCESQYPKLMTMQMDNSDNDCCQKNCCCPAGLLSVAVLIDDPFKAYPDFNQAPVISQEPAIRTVFLTQLQRPPKSFSV